MELVSRGNLRGGRMFRRVLVVLLVLHAATLIAAGCGGEKAGEPRDQEAKASEDAGEGSCSASSRASPSTARAS